MYNYGAYASSSQFVPPPMMMMKKTPTLSTELIARSISYHGLPLQKMWEGERGEMDLHQQGLTHPDYSIYQMRQKYLTFQDRAKRLMLHQFISKKADQVFDQRLLDYHVKDSVNAETDAVVQIPPYEVFLNVDPYERTRHFFQTTQRGDVVYGSVAGVTKASMLIKIICVTGSIQRFVGDLGIKAMIPMQNTVPVFNKLNDRYDINDYVCCEVLDLSPESQKIILSMKGEFPRKDDKMPPFGLITTDNFPEVFKTAAETKNQTYNVVLENSSTFKNPSSEDILFKEVGLDPTHFYTNMTSLRGKFPSNEYASQIRQDQAGKWAFRSVAEGIEHFKEGRHSEAFSCLNKALSIDPRNVEGLVARGALYANSGSFKKAVEDFEAALVINVNHANARKYLGETLVALGRSYEEENKYEEARKAYQDCLTVIPMHEEALNSLEFLRTRGQTKMIVPPTELVLPPLNINKSSKSDEHGKHESRHDKKKKEKTKKKRKRHGSSSDSSSSSGSSSSSSRSSSSSSDSDHSRHKGKKHNETSPFSQQMMKGSYQFNQPFAGINTETDDYESKVRQFLEMARVDDDHEDKVRKLITDAARYQEERKSLDSKSKKKKKKEEKKAKKDAKKKRKKDKKSKKPKLDLNEIENAKIREALKIFESLPVLDDLGAKLSEIYGVKNESPSKSTHDAPLPSQYLPKSLHDEDTKTGKWKMSFKDEPSRNLAVAGSSLMSQNRSTRPGKGLSPPDSDDETRGRAKDMNKGKQAPSKRIPSPLKQYGRTVITRSPPITTPAPVKSGPVVLDKFGNFRLATPEPIVPLPTETTDRRMSRSRSRSFNYNRRRRSRSSSEEFRRRHKRTRSRSTSRDLYRRLAISRSRSRSRSRRRSPVRPFRGNRGRGSFKNRGRSRSPVSPIRSTNPLGRPFGGGRGRGTGRWERGGKKYFGARRDKSHSPKRQRSRSRDRKSDRSNDKPNSKDKFGKDVNKSKEFMTKNTESHPNKIPQFKDVPQTNVNNDDPPPPGTEDEIRL